MFFERLANVVIQDAVYEILDNIRSENAAVLQKLDLSVHA